jgi:hypothetical protein
MISEGCEEVVKVYHITCEDVDFSCQLAKKGSPFHESV